MDNFLNQVVQEAKDNESSAQILNYFQPASERKQLSIHNLICSYLELGNHQVDVEDFLSYCTTHMSEELCTLAEKDTSFQSKSSLWYELRYARITASKIFEAAHCSTKEGALVETIFGASSMTKTDAMRRGLLLEDKVLQVVSKKFNIAFKKTGIILDGKYPSLGALPDAVSEEFVVEIKCPSKKETIKNYLKPNGKITPKCEAQIQWGRFPNFLNFCFKYFMKFYLTRIF